MIRKIEQIPVTKESYPFGSAERYCNLSAEGYEEKEYYMHGTSNVYRSVDEHGNVEVMTKDVLEKSDTRKRISIFGRRIYKKTREYSESKYKL